MRWARNGISGVLNAPCGNCPPGRLPGIGKRLEYIRQVFAGNALHEKFQQEYRSLLELLFNGYSLGIPAGAPDINAARNAMLGAAGLDGAAEAVAADGFW